MNWSVIREIGIKPSRYEKRGGDGLTYPVSVEQGVDGTRLIIDEIGLNRSLAFRMACRTCVLDSNGNIIFDSLSQGIDDGYGCIIEDGLIAILRRSHWDIIICSYDGIVTKRIDLSNVSKFLPRIMVWTYRKTFLLVFLTGVGRLDIAEIGLDGELLWYLPPRRCILEVPGSVQLLPNNCIIVADQAQHVVLEIQSEGSTHILWGELRNPAPDLNHLSNPNSAKRLPDGALLIADTHNHRIISVDKDGAATEVLGHDELSSPTFVHQIANGHLLLCDGGNGRVMELDQNHSLVWQYGRSPNSKRYFSFPRSVEVDSQGHYLIADTANNRVVRVRGDGIETWPFRGVMPLFWPRAATKTPDGSLLVADGRNSRVIEISEDGELLHELFALDSEELELGDPHDIRYLPNRNILITDPGAGFVAETDWTGKVYRLIGRGQQLELDDPHNAELLSDESVLIADTGHARYIRVDRRGRVVQEVFEFHNGLSRYRFSEPRYACMSKNGVMIVVDTGNNRILAADRSGKLLWKLSSLPGSHIPFLLHPRWAYVVRPDEVLVTDHFHHRILHLKHDPA